MKEIKMSRNMVALVDDEDYEFLSQWKWFPRLALKTGKYYGICNFKTPTGRKPKAMHHMLFEVPEGMMVDHKDRDTLNNQKNNLRLCNRTQNAANQKISRVNTSGYKGVIKHNKNKTWVARIGYQGQKIYLGEFKVKEDAARAYNEAAVKYFGEFARPNVIKDLKS